MPSGLYTFPAPIQEAVQKGILENKFRKGLDSSLAYAKLAFPFKIGSNIGDTVTMTRNGRKVPNTTARTPASMNSDLKNGMTSSTSNIEQYSITVQQYGDMEEINILQQEAGIKSQSVRAANNLGVQASQSKDRLARQALMDAYLGGNSRVTNKTTATSTACSVDDIRGFQQVLANGKPVPVDNTNTMIVQEIDASGAVVRTLTVTQVTVDGSNSSDAAALGGVSGALVFTASPSAAPSTDNALVAVNAPKVLRAGGKTTTKALTGADLFTLDMVDDGVAYLRSNGIDAADEDGFYWVILSASSMRQLRKDPQFSLSFQGQAGAQEIRKGRIYEYGGVRYMETTEAPIQVINGLKVHRPLLLGYEAVMEAEWDGFAIWLQSLLGSANHIARKIANNMAFVVRAPLDVLGQQLPQAWYLVTGYCCGTDLTATTDIIPTGTNALYKRALFFEHIAA